jgi:hypothetical protein
MFKTIEERNLAIIEVIMLELGVSDIEELPAKVIELKNAAEQGVHLTELTPRQKEEVEQIVMRFIILAQGESPRK